MISKDYRALAAELHKENLLKPKAIYGVATVVGELLVFGTAFAFLLRVEPLGPAFWALQVFLGMSTYRFFVIVHESGHKSLFESATASTLTGLLASVFCFMPFYCWRSIHFLHHKWVGVIDKDPTQAELMGLKNWGAGKNLLFRVLWFSWQPLMFFVYLFRIFWAKPLRDWKKGDLKEARRGLLSVMVVLLPRVALLSIFGWKWMLLYLGPMTYLYLFCNEAAGIAQHTGLFPFLSHDHPKPIPLHEQDTVSRTSASPGLWSIFFGYNFNLHTEHHLFPSVPWYWLPRVGKRVEHLETYRHENFFAFTLQVRTTDPIETYTKALPTDNRPGVREAVPIS